MKTRFSFKNHLSHYFFVYALLIVASTLVCSFSINLKTKPKSYEQFSFFSEVNFVNEGNFKQKLSSVVPEDLEINLYSTSKNDKAFNYYFSAYGLNSDICLLSKSLLEQFTSIQFLNLKGTAWEKTDNYIFGEYSIGIKCQEGLKQYFTFADDDYYLLVMKNSVHLKGLNNSGLTDQVNRVLEYITAL